MRYLYLALALTWLAGAIFVIGGLRRDLWRPITAAGIVGAFIESVSEIWYLQDYWNPPTILSIPIIEDTLYGFGVTAAAACAYPFWFGKRYVPTHQQNRPDSKHLIALLSLFVAAMACLSLTPILSIWNAIILFVGGGIIAVWHRPDLAGPAMAAGLIMGMAATITYGIALNLPLGEAFLRQVYLPAGTAWDIRVLGNVPLDEIAWNMARGWCVAAMYPYLSGQRLQPRRP